MCVQIFLNSKCFIIVWKVPTLSQLREKFSELARGELHLGLDPQAPSIDDPNVTVEMERY